MLAKKNNWIAATAGTVLFLTVSATTALASSTAKSDEHRHHSTQHTDKKSTDRHDHHQCDHSMSSVDSDKDGKISREEFIKHHEQMFDKKDTNKDGFLDESELHHMMDHMHKHKHDHGDSHKKGSDHTHGGAKQ